ncbi:CBS domain-containing protein [Pseudomonas sp. KB-10]|uniref:HPP family protein n=1 Tax=Pseudomonas sp. KB-10 TaxID=2292264 RepID=UPI001BAF86B8|nr:CBS domain-containing protein [Pseudomonas sp. KB-10]
MNTSSRLYQWCIAFIPDAAHTRPREWLRAALGACIGFVFSTWLCSQLFGLQLAVHFSGPLAASAVLLFAVSSGALAQPWSILGSYLCATLVGLLVGHWLDHSLIGAALAISLSLLLMCPLRCLHPPGGAIAFCVVFAPVAPGIPAWHPAVTAVMAALGLLSSALIYNNLTGMRYPRQTTPPADAHHTRDPLPGERVGIRDTDLDQALDELGAFVDVTREDLAMIVKSTERHALRRSMGDIRAGQVMSRDLVCATPGTSIKQGLHLLRHHHLKALPILDHNQRLVGIVSLSDLIAPIHRRPARRFGLFRRRPRPRLGELMSSPVRCTDVDTHVVDLIGVLSDRGLHCLPVLENEKLVGIITQTDVIAALQRDLLAHFDWNDDL